MKTRYEFDVLLLGGEERGVQWLDHRILHSSIKSISGFSGAEADVEADGRREAAAEGAGGTKRSGERISGFPLPPRGSQASLSPLSKKDGGAICEPFFELFTKGEVASTSGTTERLRQSKSQQLGLNWFWNVSKRNYSFIDRHLHHPRYKNHHQSGNLRELFRPNQQLNRILSTWLVSGTGLAAAMPRVQSDNPHLMQMKCDAGGSLS